MASAAGTLEARVPPFHDLHPGEQVMLALSIAAGEMGTRIERVLRAHDPMLTHARYNALRILRGAGEDGLSCSDIGARLLIAPPEVTRLIHPLAERGYVARFPDPDDRRVVLHRLTVAGVELLADLDRQLARIYDGILTGLGAEVVESLVDGCERFIELAGDIPDAVDQVAPRKPRS